MKPHKQIIFNYLVVALLAIYQISSFMHMATLPKITGADYYRPVYISVNLNHKAPGNTNSRGNYQRGIYFGNKNLRKSIKAPAKAISAAFAFIPAKNLDIQHKGYHRNVLIVLPQTERCFISLCNLRV